MTLLNNPRLLLAFLLLAASILASSIGVAIISLKANDPLVDNDCAECHLAGKGVAQRNASLLVRSEEQLCSSCHSGAVAASHPSGVIPSMDVPEIFPLDWKGDLTCSSCHFIHEKGHGGLRMDVRGEPFCTSCHELEFFERMADQGGSLMISGHLSAGAALEGQGIDSYSVQCMVCHESKAESPELQVSIDAQGVARHAAGSVNHPIGVSYAQAASYGGYRRQELLPEMIALPNGLLSCISCHQGYSSEHGAVVTTLEGSNLCFQCHDL